MIHHYFAVAAARYGSIPMHISSTAVSVFIFKFTVKVAETRSKIRFHLNDDPGKVGYFLLHFPPGISTIDNVDKRCIRLHQSIRLSCVFWILFSQIMFTSRIVTSNTLVLFSLFLFTQLPKIAAIRNEIPAAVSIYECDKKPGEVNQKPARNNIIRKFMS